MTYSPPPASGDGAAPTVGLVGLGYVGLPLALAFGKRFDTIAYDLDQERVGDYRSGRDRAGEVAAEAFAAARLVRWSSDPEDLRAADVVIVTVPTPVDAAKQPDLTHVKAASTTVGRHMKRGAVVVYESTVYPGCTEEVCVPILEACSGMRCGVDFRIGYSPERINPGDYEHTLDNVIKVVAGQDAETLDQLAWLYEQVVSAGVYRAPSIQVAEAAKVIENTQRDLNIALINELAIIFHHMGLDTQAVLETALTKWNFLPFRPGLVGGHCIGVDPYYLTHKAQRLGYHPEVILAGRRINDGMGKYIAEQTIKQMIISGHCVNRTRVAVLGLTFKEDCADLRNSRVIDIVRELQSYDTEVFVHDPLADAAEAWRAYRARLMAWDDLPTVEALILAVAHRPFRERPVSDYIGKLSPEGTFVDVKAVFDPQPFEAAGIGVWRL